MNTLDSIFASTIPSAIKDRIFGIIVNENISQKTRFFVIERTTSNSEEKVFQVFQIPDSFDNHDDSCVLYSMFSDGMIYDKVEYTSIEGARGEWNRTFNYCLRMKSTCVRIL